MALTKGDVVLVPFPFRDQRGESVRPGVVVSGAEYNATPDVIVAAVTSHSSRGPWDYELADWSSAGLRQPSTVRMMLFSIAQQRILLQIGRLSAADWTGVNSLLQSAFH